MYILNVFLLHVFCITLFVMMLYTFLTSYTYMKNKCKLLSMNIFFNNNLFVLQPILNFDGMLLGRIINVSIIS